MTRPPLALAYHGVADVPLRDDPYGLFVRPADLARHIRRLQGWGYRLVTFGELARRAADGEAHGYSALTFDDGLADNLTAMLPVIRAAGVPATAFVVSEWLGRTHPQAPRARLMTAPEVRTLADAGVEVGAHTASHPDLTAVAPETAEQELRRGREALEAIVDRPVEVAAYPFGKAAPTTVRACASAGFRAACLASGRGSWSEPFALPRQDMDNRCTLLGLRLKRQGRYEAFVATPPGAVARRVFRAARRLGR